MFSLPKLKEEEIQSYNNGLIINNENPINKVSYEYFSMKIPKQSIEILLNSERDERYIYFLRYGLLRRYEGKGDILYVEIPQIPKNLVIYRKPSIRNKFTDKLYLNKKDLPHVPLLEGEENLKLLSLECNHICKIDHLISLNNLLFLNLYENKISEIENLQSVPKLKALMLGKNQISRIKNLNFLSELEVLDLHSNKIKIIENLFTLKKLRILNLANNQITSFLDLMNNRNLEEINLRKNLIFSIPNLSNHFDQLKRMNIAKNMINKIEFILEFKKLRKLEELFIEENPVINQKDSYKKLNILPLKFKNPILFNQFKNNNNENNEKNERKNSNLNFPTPKIRSLSSISSKKNIRNNYDEIPTTRSQTRHSSNCINLSEKDRKNLISKIENEWIKEFKFIINNGFNGYNIKRLKETKIQLCHAELEKDKQLNIFGNALEVLGYSEFHMNVHTIHICFLNYDLLYSKVNIDNFMKFHNLKSLIFENNNLYNYYQIIKLENLKNVEYITIKNNEICCSSLLKYFLIYRFQNIKYYNSIGINEKDIIMSKKIFEPFDKIISICENQNNKNKNKNDKQNIINNNNNNNDKSNNNNDKNNNNNDKNNNNNDKNKNNNDKNNINNDKNNINTDKNNINNDKNNINNDKNNNNETNELIKITKFLNFVKKNLSNILEDLIEA